MPVPVRRNFDYSGPTMTPGTRDLVPFGKRKLVGVVVSCHAARHQGQLRPILQKLDPYPVFSQELLRLLTWASDYYHYPLGEVLNTALPSILRTAKPLTDPFAVPCYTAVKSTLAIAEILKRAPKQLAVYDFINSRPQCTGEDLGDRITGYQTALKALLTKELVTREVISKTDTLTPVEISLPSFSAEQTEAYNELQILEDFKVNLLQGITGSGKTRIYIETANNILRSNKQVLILVPEISLTPQLVTELQQGLGHQIAVLHSGLRDSERYRNWWLAHTGKARVVLGTRSSVFTPFQELGGILIDEEHDASYKQQDGFRYDARNLAIKRASIEKIPVVLGSATPMMESINNAKTGKYHLVHLNSRFGDARLPDIEIINTRDHRAIDGLSQPLIKSLQDNIRRKEQSIVFINRRGYAPVVHCVACDWQMTCPRCTARMTYHAHLDKFRCHHCASQQPALENCPECQTPVIKTGVGTQRIVSRLNAELPAARVLQLDRDNITSADSLTEALESFRQGDIDIIVGTQLIVKGHDFENVTLVGIADADQGLYGVDFRSSEHMFQQMIQVSGRAGRSKKQGKVLIQTNHPENPIFRQICAQDYAAFTQDCLLQRSQAAFPPFTFLAMWRTEANSKDQSEDCLKKIRTEGLKLLQSSNLRLEIMDVVSSPLEKLAGRYRFQLLVRSQTRNDLHNLLKPWVEAVESSKWSNRVRWSIDIDPIDMH